MSCDPMAGQPLAGQHPGEIGLAWETAGQNVVGRHPGEIGLDWETKEASPTPTSSAVMDHPGEIRLQSILGEEGARPEE
jgi:hypothetical protein